MHTPFSGFALRQQPGPGARSSDARAERWRLTGEPRVSDDRSSRTDREYTGRRGPGRSLPVVALLVPGVAAHVVAVALPEAGPVFGHELEAAQPLGTFPEVEVRHEQSERPAVIGGDILAVATKRQEHIVPVEVFQRHVRREVVLSMGDDVLRLWARPNLRHDVPERHALPIAVEHAPASDAMDILLDDLRRE